MLASEEIRKRLREGGQKPPSSVLPSEQIREKLKSQVPTSEIIRRKRDKDPESLYDRYNEGDPELDQEQLKIVFDKQREQPLVDQAVEVATNFFPRAVEIGTQAAVGLAKVGKETVVDQVVANPAGALADIVGLPVDTVAEGINKVSTSLGGDRVYATQFDPSGSTKPFLGSKSLHPWDRNAQQAKEAADAEFAARSVASGMANDLEETAGSALKFYNFGSSFTDRVQEAFGTKTKKESFQDFTRRTYMTREAAAKAKENPDRAAALLAENPLVRPVMAGISALEGVELTPEQLDAAQEDYRKEVLAKSIVPDPDMAMAGEILNPVGLPSRLVNPVSKAIEKPFSKGADLTAKVLTGAIKGVHPVEAVGLGLEKASEFSRKSGRKLSQVLTGDPDTALKDLSLIPQVPTYLPGKVLTTTGRLLRDAGRQIDKQGMRGRKGLAERLGADEASGAFSRALFGTTKGGLMRARSADWIGRYTGAMTRAGTSGAALNVMLGLPEIENPTQLGQSLGTGGGIGVVAGLDPMGRVSALIDPTTDFTTKVDRFIDPDPGSRRLDEDADIARFMAMADESTKAKINAFSDVNARIATLDEQIQQFQGYRDSTKNSQDWKFWQDEMNTLIRHRNTLDKNKNNKDFVNEVQRQVALDFADSLEQLKAIGNQAGLGSPGLKILDDANAEEEIRKIWGKTLTDAEFFRSQLAGKPTLEPNEAELLQKADQTIKLASDMVEAAKNTRGFAIHKNHYVNQPAHLIPANLDSPAVILNGNLLSHLGREGFNPGHTLRHESFHVLKQFKEVRDALGLEQLEQQMFGRKIRDESGRVIAEIPGVYNDDAVMRYGLNYAARMGGQSFIDQFDSVDKFLEYIREEMVVENYATAGNVKGGLRAATDSTGQTLVDWIEAKTRNGSLKQLKEALRQRGIIFNNRAEFSQALGVKIDPESAALMRRVTRLLKDEIGSYTFETDALNPDGTEKVRDDGDIPWAVVMANPALQEQYISDDRFVKDQVLVAYDDAGNKISEVVLPEGVKVDPYIAQYYVKDGKIVDEAGNEIILAQPVNLSALPNGSKVEADFKIRRNPDGTPVVISPREANARATKRGKIIYDAIASAPEDGMPKMRDLDNNGVLTGVLSPTQLQAVLNLPNDLVPARLKRIIAEGNAMLQRKDGTRAIIDYQAVYRGGKARSLAPRVRDIVPLSWRISQKQNFLFTSISVSRMFDKLNVWSSKFPENLTLWNGDTFSFWQDLLKVLNNHNAGLTGDGKNSSNQYVGERLDADDAVAELKKNRVNDFFNLFDKGTEALNPMRTKIKAKKGQDSPDRLIMSARVDRINHFQESASPKLPVDYGKMKINFMPNLNYTVPSDPRTLMADFYLINYLSGFSDVPFQTQLTGLTDASLAKYSGENPETINFLRSEDYGPIVKVTQDRLQTFLKEHLLDQVFFSLSAEIRHAIKRQQDPAIYGPIMNQYIKYFSAYDAPSPYEGRKPEVPKDFTTSENIRKKSWQATTRALENYTGKDFAKARRKDLALEMAKVFREGQWSSGYGGPKWAQIAEAFVLLHYANTPEKIAFAIDKVYDLQHNTNTVFNKIEKYAKDGGYSWVMQMLDFKYHLKNPRELLPLVSSDLKKLALPVLRDFGNKTAPTKEYLQKVATDEVGPEAVNELTELIQKMKPGYSIYSRIGVAAPKESGMDFSKELSKWLSKNLDAYSPPLSDIITRDDGSQYAVPAKPPEAFIQLAQLLIAEKMGMARLGQNAPSEIKQVFENVKNQNLQEADAKTKEDADAPTPTLAGVKVKDSEILQAAQDLVSGKKNTVRFGEYSFKLETSSGYSPTGEAYSEPTLVWVDETGAAADEVNPLSEGVVPTDPKDSDNLASLYYTFIKDALGIDKKQPFTDFYLNFVSDTLAKKGVGEKIEFQESTPDGLETYSAVVVDELNLKGYFLPIKVVNISKKGPNGFTKLFNIKGSDAKELKTELKKEFRALQAGAKPTEGKTPTAGTKFPYETWKSQMLDALQTDNWYKSNAGPIYSKSDAEKLLKAIVDEKTGELTTDLSLIQNNSGVKVLYNQQKDFVQAAIAKAEAVDFVQAATVKPDMGPKPNLDIIPPSWNKSGPATKAADMSQAELDNYIAENLGDLDLEFYDIDNIMADSAYKSVNEKKTKAVFKEYYRGISQGIPHSQLIDSFIGNGGVTEAIGDAIDQAIKNAVDQNLEDSGQEFGPPMSPIVSPAAAWLETTRKKLMAEYWDEKNKGYFGGAYSMDDLIPVLNTIVDPDAGLISADTAAKIILKSGLDTLKLTPDGLQDLYSFINDARSSAVLVFGDGSDKLEVAAKTPAKETTPANEPVFGTTDPYVYHLTSSDPSVLSAMAENGLLPSNEGYSGPGVYMANTPDATEYYDTVDNGVLLRINKNKLIEKWGKYPQGEIQYDEGTGEIYIATGTSEINEETGEPEVFIEAGKADLSIPPEWLEYKNSEGNWVPLKPTPQNKGLQEPVGEKELYQLESEDGESGLATDDLFSFQKTSGGKQNILELWKQGAAWPSGTSETVKESLKEPWKLKLFQAITKKLVSQKNSINVESFGTAYAEEILDIHQDAWNLLQDISAESFQKGLDLAVMQDMNSIIQATSFEPELYKEYEKWTQQLPPPPNSKGTGKPPASFMPSEYGLESGEKSESRLTPKILYNLYYMSTEGDPGTEYGRSLQKEYVNKYTNIYMDVFSDLVRNQINKYIKRGRADSFVTKEALQNAKSASQLDELMRGTYRSDMQRRNEVWNFVTEFLKGLESAQTREQRLFFMDRLNNAIHNTDELLFSKFSNASDLMSAFNLIANARDVRAYSRNVDKDLRSASTFGGPPGSFMPTVLSEVGLTPDHMQNINAAFRDRNRLKDMVARFVKTGNEEDFTAIAEDLIFSVLLQEPKAGQGRPLPSMELGSWLKDLRRAVRDKDAADIKRARSAITRLVNDPRSFNTKEIAEIITKYVNEDRGSQDLWRIEGAAPYTGEPVESFRGIALNGPLIEGLKVGDMIEIDSGKYESWSTDPKVAVRFATKISNTGMDSFGSTMQWLRNRNQAEKENRKGLPGDFGLILSTTLDSDSVAIDVSQLNANSRYVDESELIARPGKKLVTIAAIYRDYGEDSTPEKIEKSIYENRDFTIELDLDSVENRLMAHARRNWRNREDYDSYVEKSNQTQNAIDSKDNLALAKLLNEAFEADDVDAEALASGKSDSIKVIVKNTNPLNIHRYFGKGESLSKVGQGMPSFMPSTDLSQVALDKRKAKLPKVTFETTLNRDGSETAIIYAENGEEAGQAKFITDIDAGIQVLETLINGKYRGKGYGEALYRELAKHAQMTDSGFLVGDSVTEAAAKVRNKLFEQESDDFAWVESGDPMVSRVNNAISYMPAFNDVGPGLAETSLPDTNQGPLSGASFMPSFMPSSEFIDLEQVRSFKTPKPKKIDDNLWQVGNILVSKEPDSDAAAMIHGFEKLALHTGGHDTRKSANQVFATLKDNPYFVELLSLSQKDLEKRGIENLYRSTAVNPKTKKELTRDVKSFSESYEFAKYLSEVISMADDRREAEIIEVDARKFPLITNNALTAMAEKLGIDRSNQPKLRYGHLEMDETEQEVFVAPSKLEPTVAFMPGYNPRYTDENGDFDREAWLNDRRRAEEFLRRRGVYRSSVTEEEWERLIRDALRELRRGY